MVFGVSIARLDALPGAPAGDIRGLFETLRSMGVGGVKVGYEPPEEHPDWQARAADISNLAREFGFQLAAHGPGGDISSVDDTVRGAAVETIRRALADLGAAYPRIVVAIHPEDYLPPRTPGDDRARMDACRESLRTLAATAEASGARVALENMRHREDNPNRTGMYVDQLTEIVDGLDPAVVGICFDTGHANISEKTTVAEAFARCADRVIHVHLDDNHGVDDEHLQPGDGEIDFAAFFAAAGAATYRGMIELEVKLPEGAGPLDFLRRNARYYHEHVSEGI